MTSHACERMASTSWSGHVGSVRSRKKRGVSSRWCARELLPRGPGPTRLGPPLLGERRKRQAHRTPVPLRDPGLADDARLGRMATRRPGEAENSWGARSVSARPITIRAWWNRCARFTIGRKSSATETSGADPNRFRRRLRHCSPKWVSARV